MKVFVMTKAKIFEEEMYVGVKKSKKEAETAFRKQYPHMRADGLNGYISDASSNPLLLFIHDEEV